MLILLCKVAGFCLLTLNIAHTNVTQGIYLIVRILHTYVPTMWEGEPLNHRTVPQQHDIYQLYIIWVTKSQPRRVMWALALQEIVTFTLLTTTPSTHTCWGGVAHQHTHVLEDNTSAHTCAGS